MQNEIEELRAAIEALREEVAALRKAMQEMRDYIGEVPAMECGITPFEDWQRDRR